MHRCDVISFEKELATSTVVSEGSAEFGRSIAFEDIERMRQDIQSRSSFLARLRSLVLISWPMGAANARMISSRQAP